MKTTSKVFSCACLVIFAVTLAQAKEWRGIVPLSSTRADVEKQLGPPTKMPCNCVYDLGNESVFIIYAGGPPCKDNAASAWQVPRDTVIEITVIPKTELRVSDIRLDLSKFEKRGNQEQRSVNYYIDAEEGISIEVNRDIVVSVTYFPAAKDKYLHCPKVSTLSCK